MKKIFVTLLIFLVLIPNAYARNQKVSVVFSKCIDGDTAKFILNKKEITVRFLAIDTPETKHPKKGVEPFGKEASNYTCKRLKEAKTIELEYDGKDKIDKYDRHLAWIFVDHSLLQKELIQKGYAEVAYLYDDYNYTEQLKKEETKAKLNGLGKWNDNAIKKQEQLKWIGTTIAVIIIILLFFFNKQYRKKSISKLRRKVKKKISNLI